MSTNISPLLTASDPSQPEARFVTSDAVHVDVRIARIGSRAMAKLIDLLVQVALIYILSLLSTILLVLLAPILDSSIFEVIVILVVVAVFIGYPVLMETLARGRTVGKLILGLRVVRDDGGPITFRHALARGLVGAAIEWPGLIAAPLTWLVTIAVMLSDPRSRRLGDQVAGTLVVHDRTPAAWGWAPTMPPGLAGWAATLDLTGLDDSLALTIRHYLARNRWLREPARTQLGERLAREVAAVTQPPPPVAATGWTYLAAVHAERHNRAARQLAAARARSAAVWPDLTAAVAAPPTAPTRTGPTRTGPMPTGPAPTQPTQPTPIQPMPTHLRPSHPTPAHQPTTVANGVSAQQGQ